MPSDPGHQRGLSTSAFPGDTGEASAATRERLAAFTAQSSPENYLAVVAALCGDRVLVPVVATATRVGPAPDRAGPGLVSDKEAEMSVVGVQSADGRRALLAFTGGDALDAWDATARPVPVTLDKAAEAALADGAAALVVDLAGPYPLVIEGEVLDELAAGHRLVQLEAGFGWAVTTTDPSGE